MTALTDVGNVAFAAIAPDGRYLAYADDQEGYTRVCGCSNWRLRPRSECWARCRIRYYKAYVSRPTGTTFITYKGTPTPTHRACTVLAVFGGSPQKIVSDMDDLSSVDLSPDGKQIVFTRRTRLKTTC